MSSLENTVIFLVIPFKCLDCFIIDLFESPGLKIHRPNDALFIIQSRVDIDLTFLMGILSF